MKSIIFALMLTIAASACASGRRQVVSNMKLSVKNVTKLVNYSNITLHFTQGSAYTVRLVEKGKVPSKISINGGRLIIEPSEPAQCSANKNEGNVVTVYNNIGKGDNCGVETEVYLTMPSLCDIDNAAKLALFAPAIGARGGSYNLCNSGIFTMKGDALKFMGMVNVDNYGNMGLDFKNISVENLKFNNNGICTLESAGGLQGTDVSIVNSGRLTLKMPALKANKVEFSNYGISQLGDISVECTSYKHMNVGREDAGNTIKVSAQKVNVDNSGMLKDNFDVRTVKNATMTVSNFGMMDSKVQFNGSSAKFESTGNSTITATVQCTDLSMSNFGGGTIKVNGKTVNLRMDASFAKNLDVSALSVSGNKKENYLNEISSPSRNNNKPVKRKIGKQELDIYNP